MSRYKWSDRSRAGGDWDGLACSTPSSWLRIAVPIQVSESSPQKVRTWMNRAQVFSVPSITAESGDSEAFGIVLRSAGDGASGDFATGGLLKQAHGDRI